MEEQINVNEKSKSVFKVAFVTFCITISLLLVLLLIGKNYYFLEIGFSAKTRDEIQNLNQVKSIIKNSYYLEVDDEKLLEGAIDGMTSSLGDPYTVYYTKERMKEFDEKANGSYVGIGVSINAGEDGILSVLETFEGSPAKEVGILKDDKIFKVNDEDVTLIKDENIIINKIKGMEHTKVKITVYRPSEKRAIDFEVIRKRIKIENVFNKVIDGNLGYIRINTFDNEVSQDFNKSLNDLLTQNIKGLVIDVRDNPGGSYQQVVEIADRLLPKAVIVYTKDKAGKKEVESSTNAKSLDLPIALLINEGSASASEVLAGALRANNKATLIGTKSFGKGLVQSMIHLPNGAGIKVTTATYFTPNDVNIHGVGISPDIERKLLDKFKKTPISNMPKEEDNQLQEAISVLKKSIK